MALLEPSIRAIADTLVDAFIDGSLMCAVRDAKDHLAFGVGIHYCLGAPPARLEGKIAFETLVKRLNYIRVAPEKNDLTHTEFYSARIESIIRGV